MSSQSKKKEVKHKKNLSEIFENNDISKDNIKIDLDTNDMSNKSINKNKKDEYGKMKLKKKKVSFNKHIDIIKVECWKEYNLENNVEPNTKNQEKDNTTKCTCQIF
jgi:hypothetical protein